MLEPERGSGLLYASVEEHRVGGAVERLKSTLPDEFRACSTCGYLGRAFRWGIKTYPAKWSRHVALVLCCPGCETPTDLWPDDLVGEPR